jgi:hypothetical protein
MVQMDENFLHLDQTADGALLCSSSVKASIAAFHEVYLFMLNQTVYLYETLP